MGRHLLNTNQPSTRSSGHSSDCLTEARGDPERLLPSQGLRDPPFPAQPGTRQARQARQPMRPRRPKRPRQPAKQPRQPGSQGSQGSQAARATRQPGQPGQPGRQGSQAATQGEWCRGGGRREQRGSSPLQRGGRRWGPSDPFGLAAAAGCPVAGT